VPQKERAVRVLQVDDDPLIGELLGALLPSPRFVVESAQSAQDAAQKLNANLPDVILLDLVMPRVNGFEFLQAVRADPRTRPLPVLVLTAKHLSPQDQILLQQAAQLVLPKKTFSVERLMEKLHRVERVGPLLHAPEHSAPKVVTATAPKDVDLSEFLDDFRQEARSCLSALSAILVSESQSPNAAEVESAARAVHTLKGSAALMGFAELGDLAAQAENYLRGVLIGMIALDETGFNTLRAWYEAMDQIVQKL
jgi:CheY-like chemotaxis protein